MRIPTLASLLGLAALATTGACVLRTTPGPNYGYQSQGYVSGGIAVNTPSTYYVESEPPEPLYESISASPGYGQVWIDGYWHWNGYEWVWVSGRWIRDMDGYVYISPYYDYVGGRYTYHSGYWSQHDRVPPGVIVRDHRDGRPSTGYRPSEHVPVRDGNRDHRPPSRGDVTPVPPSDPRPTPPSRPTPPAQPPDTRPTAPRPAPSKPATPTPPARPDTRPTAPRPTPSKPATPTPPAPRPDTRPTAPRPTPAKPTRPTAPPPAARPTAPPADGKKKPPTATPRPAAPAPSRTTPPAAPKDTKKKPVTRPHSAMLTSSATLALLVNDGSPRLLTDKGLTMDLDLETMPNLKSL